MARTLDASRSRADTLPLQFIVAVLAITWLFWWPATLIERGVLSLPLPTGLLVTVGAFGPLATALILTARHDRAAGVRGLLRRVVKWRVSGRWWAVVLLGPPLVMLAVMAIHVASGGAPPDAMSLAESVLTAVVTAIYMVFFVALGEEVGWRGFLLPALQTRRSALWSSVIVALVWAVWHLPLFFNPATLYSRLPFPLYVAFVIPFAILLTWVYNSTKGSLLLVILLHAMMNGSSTMAAALPDLVRLGQVSPYEANVLVNTLLTVVLAAAAVAVILLAGPENLSRQAREVRRPDEDELPLAA